MNQYFNIKMIENGDLNHFTAVIKLITILVFGYNVTEWDILSV